MMKAFTDTANSPACCEPVIAIPKYAESIRRTGSPGRSKKYWIAQRPTWRTAYANFEKSSHEFESRVMSSPLTEIPQRGNITLVSTPALPASDRKGLTKKEIAADHPTWCPGCGDFSVLALYFKLIEKRKIWHEKI